MATDVNTQSSQSWGAKEYAGAGAGILGLVGGGLNLFGPGGSPNFDYDPSKRALARYTELSNINSPYWRGMMKHYSSIISKAAPTIDTLYGFNKSAGIDSQSATALATKKADQYSGQVQDKARESVMEQFLRTEDTASKYLGMESDRAKTEVSLGTQYGANRKDSQDSFFNALIEGGIGLLTGVL